MSTVPGYHPSIGHPTPGHPMGQIIPPNPGQPGPPTGGGMPHPMTQPIAVSAPGAQINAALMGAMPPGIGNPTAHFAQLMQQPYGNTGMFVLSLF